MDLQLSEGYLCKNEQTAGILTRYADSTLFINIHRFALPDFSILLLIMNLCTWILILKNTATFLLHLSTYVDNTDFYYFLSSKKPALV